MSKHHFASDNFSGVSPEVFTYLTKINDGHAHSYGDDAVTQKAVDLFKKNFGECIDVFFVQTGTAANILAINSVTKTYNSVICADSAHLNNDECGAPEKTLGVKLHQAKTQNGKLTIDGISVYLEGIDMVHRSQPRVLSISQATELGTVYSIDELKNLSTYAHQNNLFFHIDGARLCNAAVYLNCSLKELTNNLGVDLLSFGGTKNGLMCAEALVSFNKNLSIDTPYFQKQTMQLTSKMRFISGQFIPFFENNLWQTNATNSNIMAKILANELKTINDIKILYPVETNAIFLSMPKQWITTLQKHTYFYIWSHETSETPIVRLMTSFDTKEFDIENFIIQIKQF